MDKAPVRSPLGFWINASAAMQGDGFEPHETALVRELFTTSELFVNIGANMGYYCCLAQQAGIRTLAFEPVPSNVAFIIQNMKANKWGDNITLLPVAVSDRSGFVDIYGVGTGSSIIKGWADNPRSLKHTVPAVRLDDIVRVQKGCQTLILMDVEGYEYFALKGAQNLINMANKPIWLIEIVGHGDEATRSPYAPDTFEMMLSAGYDAYRVDATLQKVTSPIKDCTNYLFIATDAAKDELIAELRAGVSQING